MRMAIRLGSMRGTVNARPMAEVCAVPCVGCGITRVRKVKKAGQDSARYCTRACYQLARVRTGKEVAALRRIGRWDARRKQERWDAIVLPEIQALRRIARYVERPASYRCACEDCGESMLARRRGRWAQICQNCLAARLVSRKARVKRSPSHLARKRAAKARRRALVRGVVADRIDPFEVFERDHWTCKLCQVVTPRSLRGTYEPNAPELDHIIPLALGGTHTWGNVQCLCRQCNGNKGANAIGQLGFSLAA